MSSTHIKGNNNIVIKDIKGEVVNITVNGNSLPQDLVENLIADNNQWSKSLAQELRKQGVSVGNRPVVIYQHYGWMIEAFLQKIGAKIEKNKDEWHLRRLSFMTEVFQNSLRYLCYIQIAQIFHLKNPPKCPKVVEFLQLPESQHQQFDLLELLFETSDALRENNPFVPQIIFLTDHIRGNKDLHDTVIFMSQCRNELISRRLRNIKHFNDFLEGFLTGLVHWLRQLVFLAKYRLISMKDISLNYRLATTPKAEFMHHYGELHGIYTTYGNDGDYYKTRAIKNVFTYNHSILLLKGMNVDMGLNKIQDRSTFLSLSPLIIDKSVFVDKITQTPEIYYYTGYKDKKRRYTFAHYKDELSIDGLPLKSNKSMVVASTNTKDSKLDELFIQIEDIFGKMK